MAKKKAALKRHGREILKPTQPLCFTGGAKNKYLP
jgi:hypothetical protein